MPQCTQQVMVALQRFTDLMMPIAGHNMTPLRILYAASTEYDYPSMEQMRMVLEQYRVVPVFGVVPVIAVSGSGVFDYYN